MEPEGTCSDTKLRAGYPLGGSMLVTAGDFSPWRMKTPITSYADLARPDLKDRVGLLTPENTGGLLSLIALGEANGGSLDNMEPAFKALAAMRANISTVTPATVNLLQLFEQEEVWVGPFFDGRTYSMRAKGKPMATVIPKEGVYSLFNYLNPVKGAGKRDAMIAEPRALPGTATAQEAGEVLTPAEVRAVYVVGDDGALLGVVTRKTLVARVVAELEAAVRAA